MKADILASAPKAELLEINNEESVLIPVYILKNTG
jgi:hypothetical protein